MADDLPALLTPAWIAQLERLQLATQKVFRGASKGDRRSPRKGQSVEFSDFRSYAPGDDIRFIDWNSYARLERLYLKQFWEEEDLRLYTLLDNSASMQFGSPSKWRRAQEIAASIGFIGLNRGDRVAVETFETRDELGFFARGRHQVGRMCDHLQQLEPAVTTDLTAGARHFCARHPGKGVVLVVSDLFDKQGYQGAIRYLLAREYDLYVIHLLAEEELRPDIRGDLRLVDSEDGETIEVSATGPLLTRYHETLQGFLSEAKDFCTRRGISYCLASTQTPLAEIVTQFLRKRGLVR